MPSFYLTGWGNSAWGYANWGFGSTSLEVPVTNGPVIIYKNPGADAVEVLENTPITVEFFDKTYNLDTTTATVTINGVLAYDGTSGFQAGFTGKVSQVAGVLIVHVIPLVAFNYEDIVTVNAYIADLTSLSTTSTWQFTVRPSPVCYSGLTPLAIEKELLNPFTTYIGLEPLRVLFLNTAIKTLNRNINNRDYKAARVIYQTAYTTELSTLLNLYDLRDEDALKTIVCEKNRLLSIDAEFAKVKTQITTALNSLRSTKALSPQYTTAFADYIDSTLYTYRVSLIANLLLYGKALESV